MLADVSGRLAEGRSANAGPARCDYALWSALRFVGDVRVDVRC